MHDVDPATLVPLSAVPRLLPPGRAGKPLHISAIHRWVHRGCRAVKLRAVVVGGRMMTHPDWLSEFIAAVTEARGLAGPTPTVRTPAARARAHRKADAELSAAGW